MSARVNASEEEHTRWNSGVRSSRVAASGDTGSGSSRPPARPPADTRSTARSSETSASRVATSNVGRPTLSPGVHNSARFHASAMAASSRAMPVQLARLEGALQRMQTSLAERGAPYRGHAADVSAEPSAPTFHVEDIPGSLQATSHQMNALDTALIQFREAVAGRHKASESGASPQATALAGVEGGSTTSLPHGAAIQAAFGTHDISGVRAHLGPAADAACDTLGARAYATGSDVVFRSGSADLFTAAHEAAHVVQQRSGVALKAGLGAAGDDYELHADAVAERVVAGRSAQDLLDRGPGRSGASAGGGVQCAPSVGWTGKRDSGRGKHGDINEAITDVEADGALQEDVDADADAATAGRRVPLEGVEGVLGGKMVVVVPNNQVLAEHSTLDVVFHFHGAGAQSVVKSQRGGQDRTNDVHVNKVPQQLVASGQPVIAVVVQWAGGPEAGKTMSNVDIGVASGAVFEHLQSLGLLTESHVAGRRYLSGHSQGGYAASREAQDPSNTGSGTVDGLFLFDGQGGKLPHAGVDGFIRDRLDADLAAMEYMHDPARYGYIVHQAFSFQGFSTGAGSFKRALQAIEAKVDAWFKAEAHPSLAPELVEAWRARYRFSHGDRSSSHDSAVADGEVPANNVWTSDYEPGSGNLEDALEHR